MFTTDTRKGYCPIRIAYGSQAYLSTSRPDSLHTNNLRPNPDGPSSRWDFRAPLAIIQATEHGDYSGGSAEASNYRTLVEWASTQNVKFVEIYGSHGYKALAYDATLGPVPDNEDLCDMLSGLEETALLDEEDLSKLESELEAEAWADHGRHEFIRALVNHANRVDNNHEHDIGDSIPLSELDELWHWGCDAFNVNGGSGYTVETGCVVHFYIDEWFTKANADAEILMAGSALAQFTVACRVSV